MQRGEMHAVFLPARVLDELREFGIDTLRLDLHGRTAQTQSRRRIKQLAQLGQPLQRVVAAVVGTVAIGPFVVAR